MGADSRHAGILDALRRRGGYAGIEELASGLAVTPQTIRRDLSELAGKGLLRRHHGGASLPSSIANTDYAVRHVENSAAKQRIARAAAALIPDGSSLFLTLGTPKAITAALASTLTTVTAPIDELLYNLLLVVGVRIGEADIRVTGVRCQRPVLVQ